MEKRYKVIKDYVNESGELCEAGDIVVLTPETRVSYLGALIKNGFIEEVKEESGEWTPKNGEKYWHIDELGRKYWYEWEDDGCDKEYASIGNVFKTEADAAKAVEWLKAFKILREDTKWFTITEAIRQQARFIFVRYDVCTKNFRTGCLNTPYRDAWIFSPIVFRTIEDAQVSIDKHAKEWKIFLGVEE